MDKTFTKGVIFASLSFFMWGVFPLYWKFLIAVDSLHILAFRILLSLVLVGAILLTNKNTAWLSVFREPKKAAVLIPTALILCCNWGLYIWAVNRGHTLEASLGYYINPLVSIVLGLVFFRERLRPLQWVAAAIAFAGVLILTVASGSLPWVSLGLALTFGFYGLLKKKLALSALESLGAETLASAPIGIALLFFSFGGTDTFNLSGWQGLGYLSGLPPQTLALLALTGLVTVLPLYCFAQGAKLLPLSTLGFTQFINPTLQFALGLFVFKENFPTHHFVAFIFIWTAVVFYIVSIRIAAIRPQFSP
jgi:chloramphenicol-sensitive protein RarD